MVVVVVVVVLASFPFPVGATNEYLRTLFPRASTALTSAEPIYNKSLVTLSSPCPKDDISGVNPFESAILTSTDAESSAEMTGACCPTTAAWSAVRSEW